MGQPFYPGHIEAFVLQPQFKAPLTSSVRPGAGPPIDRRVFAPVVLANDPIPCEVMAAADTICHASGDLLMRTSSLSGALRRSAPLDRLEEALALIGQEARAIAATSDRIAETIRALQARAGS
ncbi:hypothetical protein LJR009_001626 [Bosea sp. LjRoot9]|uniref:hypothetical protein n=1 Tax=Bosea sp. LjRoot9 TaxID=3342341 RepID=UPI003ECED4B1